MPSMTQRTRRVSRADRRDQMRDRLLAVVEGLIAEGEAFPEISVERLVTEAGISRSTFYVYFEDKGDLLLAWFTGVRASLEEAAQQLWALDAEVSLESVRDAVEAIVSAYRRHAALMATMFDAAAYDPVVKGPVSAMMEWNTAGLRKHIRHGQSEGFVDPDLDPGNTATWLTWMAERNLHQVVGDVPASGLQAHVDAYAQILWNCLYRPTV